MPRIYRKGKKRRLGSDLLELLWPKSTFDGDEEELEEEYGDTEPEDSDDEEFEDDHEEDVEPEDGDDEEFEDDHEEDVEPEDGDDEEFEDDPEEDVEPEEEHGDADLEEEQEDYSDGENPDYSSSHRYAYSLLEEEEQEAKREKRKKIALIALLAVLGIASWSFYRGTKNNGSSSYNNAQDAENPELAGTTAEEAVEIAMEGTTTDSVESASESTSMGAISEDAENDLNKTTEEPISTAEEATEIAMEGTTTDGVESTGESTSMATTSETAETDSDKTTEEPISTAEEATEIAMEGTTTDGVESTGESTSMATTSETAETDSGETTEEPISTAEEATEIATDDNKEAVRSNSLEERAKTLADLYEETGAYTPTHGVYTVTDMKRIIEIMNGTSQAKDMAEARVNIDYLMGYIRALCNSDPFKQKVTAYYRDETLPSIKYLDLTDNILPNREHLAYIAIDYLDSIHQKVMLSTSKEEITTLCTDFFQCLASLYYGQGFSFNGTNITIQDLKGLNNLGPASIIEQCVFDLTPFATEVGEISYIDKDGKVQVTDVNDIILQFSFPSSFNVEWRDNLMHSMTK